MRLVRVRSSIESAREFLSLHDGPTAVFCCDDADSAIVLASLRDGVSREVGVWLSVSADYPAQIAARDARTLSVLFELRHVVIEGADQHAEIVRLLLSGEEVTFSNDVARLDHVVSRPVPQQPLTVWSYADSALTSPEATLVASGLERRGDLELTYFEDYSG
ncbi:MAG TPA: hypothetical protein VGG21_03775 [Acidimicrobiales bacterium]